MTIESDAQKDLALETEDAENVVGGKMNKTKAHKKTAPHKAAGHSLPPINIQTPMGPGSVDETTYDPDAQ